MNPNQNTYRSNGKLLLTGEYVVLDGAVSLAVPTKFGQSLHLELIDEPKLIWKSLDEKHLTWLETEFKLQNNEILKQVQDDNQLSIRLLQILKSAQQINPDFLSDSEGYKVTTALSFPKNWGLGTSSTLIANIAKWANVNPYQLLEATFGGSGYDIACANATTSLKYQLINKQEREINVAHFNPEFKNHLYFVHLNQKQNSRDGIAHYRANLSDKSASISRISAITDNMIACHTFLEFQQLMNEHEMLISEIINQTPVKARLFSDFNGSIKSLGAWGGDFVMVASKVNPTSYFEAKGFRTILTYDAMVLS